MSTSSAPSHATSPTHVPPYQQSPIRAEQSIQALLPDQFPLDLKDLIIGFFSREEIMSCGALFLENIMVVWMIEESFSTIPSADTIPMLQFFVKGYEI